MHKKSPPSVALAIVTLSTDVVATGVPDLAHENILLGPPLAVHTNVTLPPILSVVDLGNTDTLPDGETIEDKINSNI